MKNRGKIQFIYYIVLLLLSTIVHGQKAITRGSDPGEIYIQTVIYAQADMHFGIFHSKDDGKTISLQYQNVLSAPPGIMRSSDIVGGAAQGVLYNYGFGEMWVSFDYGINWTFRENFGSSGRYASGCLEGEVYKNCSDVNGTIFRSTDYGIIFDTISQSEETKFPLEVGYLAGELYGISYSDRYSFCLKYSSDYGESFTSFPIDSTVAFYIIGGHWPRISRGTSTGEIYLVSWWPHSEGEFYKIFHSTDYGHTFLLNYTSDPLNFYYWGVDHTAGRAPGSFYVVRTTSDETFTHTHLYLDYSNDYGQTFTTYFHDLNVWTGMGSFGSSNKKKNLSLFPNPASKFLNVTLPSYNKNMNWQMQIHDIMGRVVENIELSGAITDYQVNVSNYDPGIYLVTFFDNNQIYQSKKFVVKR